MEIKSGTITVNAAFLQEIKEDNRDLRRLLQNAANLFTKWDDEPPQPRIVTEVLGDLRDRFALHFSLEEAYGYFDDALDVAPRLSERAQGLRGEHKVLYLEISEMEEDSERLLYHEKGSKALSDLGRRFFAFYKSFRSHEERETEMILDALSEEFGGGD